MNYDVNNRYLGYWFNKEQLDRHDAKVREDAIDKFVQKYKSKTEKCDIEYDCHNCCYHSCIEGLKYVEVENIAKQLKEQK